MEITTGGNNRRLIDRSSGPARGGAGRSVAVAPPTGRRVTLIDRSSGPARGGAGQSVAVAPPTGRRVTLIDRSSGPARGGAGRSVAVAPPTGRRVTLFCPRQSACVHNTSPVSFSHFNVIKAMNWTNSTD